MDVRKFVLSYYKDATDDFHINEITRPRGALTLHTHDYFQIYYLKSGSITHHIEGASAEMKPGDVFIIPPNLPHYISATPEHLRFYSISFAPKYLDTMVSTNRFIADFIHYISDADSRVIAPSFSLGEGDIDTVDMLVIKIMNEFYSENTAKENVIHSAVALLLTVLARSYFESDCASIKLRSDREVIAHCLGYIKNHLEDDITLTNMARMMAMSRTAFCDAFHRVTGEPFKSYLNRLKIEKAKELLRAGESVECAARLVGFKDPSTFYRNFKKISGIPPGKYKKT